VGAASALGEFTGIYERHFPDIHRYIAARLGRDVADDIAADTFVIALRQQDRFDASRGPVRAWLFGIATNLVSQHQRTERRRYRVLARASAEERAGGHEDRVLSRVAAPAGAVADRRGAGPPVAGGA
jgi:RNA polymerase sigma-70 factor (ECF subfamily)